MLVPEGQWSLLPDSLLTDVVEVEAYVSERWRETVFYLTGSANSFRKDCSKFQIYLESTFAPDAD